MIDARHALAASLAVACFGTVVYQAWPASQDRPNLHTPAPVAGESFRLLEGIGEVEVSTYGARYHYAASRTASGRPYDHRALTCAVNRKPGTRKPIIPFGTRLKVVYGQRSVEVVVTDTGSYQPKRTRVWLDLSSAAMAKLLGGDLSRPKTYETRVVARAWRIR